MNRSSLADPPAVLTFAGECPADIFPTLARFQVKFNHFLMYVRFLSNAVALPEE
jgi:hypothetical protein